ncbi:MAG: hypothetical protein ACYDGN_13400 [Acidimicrobiales bacterium]
MDAAHRSGGAPPHRAPGTPEEPVNYTRGAIVSLLALGLAVVVLAGLPASSSSRPRSPGTHVPTTSPTTAPGNGGSSSTTTTTTTTTTTSPGISIRVALLAPAGAATKASVQAKLAGAHYTIVPEASIPSSWVSALTAPVIHYPPGLDPQAVKVAQTLGVPQSSISPEPSGTSDGASVVEVFLPVA